MRVLCACEESQAVTVAFRNRGHEAFSCDLVPCSGGHPEWHIQDNVLNHLSDGWDMLIGFPPCTYFSRAGSCRLYRNGTIDQERLQLVYQYRDFFYSLWESDIDKICLENPVPMSVAALPFYSQVIQPFQFGHPFTKQTCLWLKNLPILMATDIVVPVGSWVGSPNERELQSSLYSGGNRTSRRSKTFPGVALAMADQWG